MTSRPSSQYDDEDNYLENDSLIASGGNDRRNVYYGSAAPDEDDYLGTDLIESKRPPKR